MDITRRRFAHFIGIVLALTAFLAGPALPAYAAPSPEEAPDLAPAAHGAITPALGDFLANVRNGRAQALVGVYVPGVLALPVLQQPQGNPGYVSEQPDRVTQFSLAAQYKTIGLLAHNTLSGELFFNLRPHQILYLVYGDGSIRYYLVTQVQRYQALSPYSPYSNFVDLDQPETELSATELFNQTYAPGNRLVFQTCIEVDGEPSWGRLFVTALPIDPQVSFFGGDSDDPLAF